MVGFESNVTDAHQNWKPIWINIGLYIISYSKNDLLPPNKMFGQEI